MTRPLPALLRAGARVTIAGEAREIERRAGTDEKPFVRVSGCGTREAADALRGEPLLVAREDLPALGEGEYWAHELEGCEVLDGERHVGTVRRMVTLPSCEALEVGDRLIPLVADAVRSVDVAARRIDVDLAFLGEA
ncbi:MAG: ribosome maturation factor RimM [Actinomycetota bacterium]|nr:ribosome maturation factor RimM [Actinomycetota bacterium]